MTGFSAQWLALREPADHRARDQGLQAQVVAYLERIATTRKDAVRLIDLGSGSGSNLRALAPHLPAEQHWTLVDYDPALLAAARATLIAWADKDLTPNAGDPSHSDAATFSEKIEMLLLVKEGKQIRVDFRCEDLALNIEAVLALPVDLITAAAFFDLVADAWLERFCHALSKPLFTVLTYNGIENWAPADSSDATMLSAFHAHQKTDKGFGVAAGPTAAHVMITLLEKRDFEVNSALSPWMLGPEDRALIQQLAAGSAEAMSQTRLVNADLVRDWQYSRERATACEIGHVDLFAVPAGAR